jgi:type II secretory pathway component PulL
MRNALFIALVLMTPSLAMAAASEVDKKQSACQGDATRLCAEFIPDRDKIADCMEKKMSQLSPACRAVFDADAGNKKKPK